MTSTENLGALRKGNSAWLKRVKCGSSAVQPYEAELRDQGVWDGGGLGGQDRKGVVDCGSLEMGWEASGTSTHLPQSQQFLKYWIAFTLLYWSTEVSYLNRYPFSRNTHRTDAHYKVSPAVLTSPYNHLQQDDLQESLLRTRPRLLNGSARNLSL